MWSPLATSRVSGILVSLLLLCQSSVVLAQLAFTNVPTTVNDGQNVQVSWTGGDGVSQVQVDLVQNGAVIDEISDDDNSVPATFTWQVELDDDAVGGTYTLRLVSAGATAFSNPINIIDENGVGAPASSTVATAQPSQTSAPASAAATGGAGSAASGTPGTAASGGAASTAAGTGNPSSAASGNPSSIPSTGIQASSAAIAATATTLLTTAILGTPVTITPASATSGSNGTSGADGASSGGGGGGGLSAGAIAGIVVGVVLGLALLGAGIWLFYRKKRKARGNQFFAAGRGGGGGGEKGMLPNGNANGDGRYLQPSPHVAGAVVGGSRGLDGPAAGSGGTPSELPSTTSKAISEVHSDSLSPGAGVMGHSNSNTNRSVDPYATPPNLYEMPASMPPAQTTTRQTQMGMAELHPQPQPYQHHPSSTVYEAPASSSTDKRSPNENAFRSPISELSASDSGGGTMDTSLSGGGGGGSGNGGVSPSITRKAVAGFGGRS